MKYYLIGDRELVLAFGLVGVEGTAAVTRDEALAAFDRVTGRTTGKNRMPDAGEKAKVLILTEEVSALLEHEVKEWQMGGKAPLIVEIPGIQGHLEGKKNLTDAIREAVGIQV